MAAVWLDETQCTGCGACVEVCPTGALTLGEGKVYLDAALCRGCALCIPVCPAGALRPVLEIEATPNTTRVPVSAPQVPVNVPQFVPASRRAGLLATVVAAGAQLALQAAPLILQSLGQWLTRSRGGNLAQSTRPLAGSGRQIRLRRRGRG